MKPFSRITFLSCRQIEREFQEWAESQAPRCAEALRSMRTFVPPDVASRTKDELTACGLPLKLAKRLVQKKHLWLIVMHPEDTAKLTEPPD